MYVLTSNGTLVYLHYLYFIAAFSLEKLRKLTLDYMHVVRNKAHGLT